MAGVGGCGVSKCRQLYLNNNKIITKERKLMLPKKVYLLILSHTHLSDSYNYDSKMLYTNLMRWISSLFNENVLFLNFEVILFLHFFSMHQTKTG